MSSRERKGGQSVTDTAGTHATTTGAGDAAELHSSPPTFFDPPTAPAAKTRGTATATETLEDRAPESKTSLDRSDTDVTVAVATEADDAPPTTRPEPPAFSALQPTVTSGSNRPYSAFPTRTKWLVSILAGVAAIFSPISSNIYAPAIPAMARDFGRSEQDITLGVTIYLIFQAITPSFIGAASDSYGRRPVFLLTMVVYIGANVGLALMPTSAYWLLLFLRALQATGGSAVISIGAGAVADVAEPRERGKFMAIFQSGAMIGPAFGPLLGGVFAETLGWRAMFWFLTIASVCVVVPFLFFFPETLRSIVGDGSIPPPALNASPIMLLQRRRMERERKEQGLEAEEPVVRPPPKPYKPLSAFMILFTPEIFLIFVYVSFIYVEFYCVLTVFSTVLTDRYSLNSLIIGVCYLPAGIATIISTNLNGRQLDWYYQREERRVGGDFRRRPESFRIDLTRIRCLYPFNFCMIAASVGLGWTLQAKTNLAGPLVMNFLVGLGSSAIGSATIYGQDLLPGSSGAVSASFNLVRCAFAAVGTAVIQLLYKRMGAGWTFVLLSGLCVLTFPLSLLVISKGGAMREWRYRKAKEGSWFYRDEYADIVRARKQATTEPLPPEDEDQAEAATGQVVREGKAEKG